MTKLAALLPALTPALIGSVGAGLAASAIDSYGQRQHRKRQESANDAWRRYQETAKVDHQMIEDQKRGETKQFLSDNLELNSGESREAIIGAETDRLTDEFTEGLPATADAVVAGAQTPGRDAVFDEAMASSLSNATAEARQRLKALATATSYGGGSQFGQGQTLAQGGVQAANDIGFTNMARNDNTGLLQQKQRVSPEILEYKQSPIVPLLQAGSAIMGGAGGDFWGKEILGGGMTAPSSALMGNVQSALSTPSVASSSVGGGGGFIPTSSMRGGFSFMPPEYQGGFI